MDDANTNKQFRIYDSSKKYIRLSVDETIARGYNHWKDWSCSAGVRGLYIDYDGNLWACNNAGAVIDRFNYKGWNEFIIPLTPKIPDASWWEKRKLLGKAYKKTINAHKFLIPNTDEMKQKYQGFLGNIFDGYDLPKEWFNCVWDNCGCGADVVLSKAKSSEHQELLVVTNNSWEGKEQTMNDLVDSIDEQVAVEMNFPIPYQILWDIGRRCNYDCSYCWAGVHNRVEEHKDFSVLVNTVDKIIDDWSHGESIRWNFGGGEPTLHPQFLELMKHLKNRNQWTMVTSNGTRDYKYWGELVQYMNSINLSAHFDGLTTEKEEDRFVRNIEAICKHFDEHDDDHWLEIKLMAPPQYVDRAVNLKSKIESLGTLNKPGANNRIKGMLSLVPIRSLLDGGKLVEYTEEQLEKFKYQ